MKIQCQISSFMKTYNNYFPKNVFLKNTFMENHKCWICHIYMWKLQEHILKESIREKSQTSTSCYYLTNIWLSKFTSNYLNWFDWIIFSLELFDLNLFDSNMLIEIIWTNLTDFFFSLIIWFEFIWLLNVKWDYLNCFELPNNCWWNIWFETISKYFIH